LDLAEPSGLARGEFGGPRTRSTKLSCRGRVGEDVTTLTPHRSGRAGFPLPVPRGRVSLTVSRMVIAISSLKYRPPALTDRRVFVPLASSAIHCRFVNRFEGFIVPSRVSPVPRFLRYYEGATTSQLRISGHLLVRFHCPTDPPASCPPQRSQKVGGPFQARALGGRPPVFPAICRVWTQLGPLRSSGDPSRTFAPFPDPGRTDVPSPFSVTSMLPPLPIQRRLRRLLISGLTPAALAPAAIRFALRVATRAQGSLPAGWLAFAGRASNPLDRYERFQFV
jgi:hypothetical protein